MAMKIKSRIFNERIPILIFREFLAKYRLLVDELVKLIKSTLC